MRGYCETGDAFGRVIHELRPHCEEPRPVVEIDPEDHEQVERLLEGYLRNSQERAPLARMYHALRSLIAPPRPPEPEGLGAVVVDEKGLTWVRRHPAGDAWVNGYGRWDSWDAITAVRVLSEGVTPDA
jgi:hypothetical protein